MRTFQYIRAGSPDEACSALNESGEGASILAGGTDALIEWRRSPAATPRVVVDISHLSELRGVVEDDGTITIMPLTTHADLLGSGILRHRAPLVSLAASTIGSPQIRNRGTIGGNLMNAAPCADLVPPLIALGAVAILRSVRGTRRINVADLFLKPYQTVGRADELLTGIEFPKPSAGIKSTFIKLGRRNALSIARLSVAAMIDIGRDGRIADARIVPGAAFPIWQRVSPAEQMLLGEKPSEKLFRAAGKQVAESMISCTGRRWSTEYKEPVLEALVRRALEQCSSETRQEIPGRETSSPTRLERKRSFLESPAPDGCTIGVTVNGRSIRCRVRTNQTLLDLLRTGLGLTGTKCGCEIGECGACTVLLDGRAVNSCLVLAVQADGCEIATVEGLMTDGNLHPLQESFLDHGAVHCGFCTPGMLMSAKALLDEEPRPSERDIRTAIAGNLCRCTGYVQIVEAVRDVESSSGGTHGTTVPGERT